MKKNVFSIICLTLLIALMPHFTSAQNSQRSYYELKVYHFTSPEQEVSLDNYFAAAYLPALHRLGYQQIGVFKPLVNKDASDKRIYVMIPLRSLDESVSIYPRLQQDAAYMKSAKSYIDATNMNPPYNRIETIFLRAYEMAPQLTLPNLKGNKAERIYELRSYEGATEKYYWNKIQMFNQGGETDIFKSLNFNAIFYGEVVAGSRMPNLMYMTSFENMEDHDNHWKAFTTSPVWKKLSSDPVYQNNVSKQDIILTHPASYSDY